MLMSHDPEIQSNHGPIELPKVESVKGFSSSAPQLTCIGTIK